MSCCKSQACRLGEFPKRKPCQTSEIRKPGTKSSSLAIGVSAFCWAMVRLALTKPSTHRGFRHLGRASCAPRRARDTESARHDRSPDTQSVVHSEYAAKA